MQKISLRLIAFVTVTVLILSCQKSTYYANATPIAVRKIEFQLYTEQNFSNETTNITFSPFIKDSANNHIWDTTLATMKVKDIPDMLHKLVIDKTIPSGNNSLLVVGFNYYLENIGYSWYIDTAKAGEAFKTVQYSFR